MSKNLADFYIFARSPKFLVAKKINFFKNLGKMMEFTLLVNKIEIKHMHPVDERKKLSVDNCKIFAAKKGGDREKEIESRRIFSFYLTD